MQINAAARIMATEVDAASANAKKAEKWLESVGFTGLEYKSDKEDLITFHYSSYNEKKLAKAIGQPKGSTKTDSIRYTIGTQGQLIVWPEKNIVKMRNSARNVK